MFESSHSTMAPLKAMHYALEIDEVLLNIVEHCNVPLFKNYRHGRPPGIASDLIALAATCRLFREPALDALWSELSDLSPLARCLPEISFQITPGFKWYSFRRPLEEGEWVTLRSYTRRVRSVLDFGSAFRPECVRTFLNPPDLEPLFPNLRYLRCTFATEVTPLLYQHLPSLISLNYSFVSVGNLLLLRESLQPFPGLSSNIKELAIRVHQPEATFDKLVSDYLCRWSNPRVVYCPHIALDANALTHLARVSDLTQLTFSLSSKITPSDTLLFPTLRELKLFSESLSAIVRLLANAKLPAVTDLNVEISTYPSKQDFRSFLTALHSTGISNAIMKLRLTQIHYSLSVPRPDPLVLTADDLQPSTAFRHLRRLNLNLGWGVDLTDAQLLELAPSWPHLECLLVNVGWGWQSPGGITPEGLIRLLQCCPSLTRVALALDTRGYAAPSPSPSPSPRPSPGPGLGPIPPSFALDVVDSVIDATSVPGVAAFLGSAASSARFTLRAWGSWAFTWRMNGKVYAGRWGEVYARAVEVVGRRCSSEVG